MRVHSWARAGTFCLVTSRFDATRRGRAAPPVPRLTYPFCTRAVLRCRHSLPAQDRARRSHRRSPVESG